VTSQEFTRRIIKRLAKLSWLIFLGAMGIAILSYLYAKKIPIVYTSRSSFYPLSSPSNNNSQTSKILESLGGGGGAKSISEDANINIEEVATSKKIREDIVSQRLPEFENKTIAQLLIEESNKHKSYFEKPSKIPAEDSLLIRTGAEMIKYDYTAKFNKNSLLVINFSSENENFLGPITTILSDKVASFYKELKIKKAKLDYEFLQRKVDSFDNLLAQYDRQRVMIDDKSLFLSPTKLKFSIPKQNLESAKLLVTSQRNSAVYNREEALLRLDKVTPTIEVLDKPTPPFDIKATSKIVYAAIGFFVGLFLFSLLFISGIILNFSRHTVTNTINEKMAEPKPIQNPE
jgi:hypothetical protein